MENTGVIWIMMAAIFLSTASGRASQTIDPAVAKEISTTWAIDNHAHPVLAPPNDGADKDFDALPADAMEQQSDPARCVPTFISWEQRGKLSMDSTLHHLSMRTD